MPAINSNGFIQDTSENTTGSHTAAIWTKNFTLLCLANLSLFISIQMMLPTLPLYVIHIGGSEQHVGYVMGAYAISCMIMRPFAGWLLDRFGRKPFAVLGLLLLFAFSLPYFFATGILSLTAIRFLHGLAFGLVSTAVSTMVADILPIRHFGEGMGYFGLTTSLSMSLAPMLGLFLTEKFDYQGLFIAICLMAALAFFISLPVKDQHSQDIVHTRDDTREKPGLFEKTAVSSSVVMFFLAVVYAAVLLYCAVYASAIGVSDIGWFFTVTALMMMVSRPISGRWTDNGGANSVILIGHCSILIAMLITASTNNLAGFIFAGALVGLGFGFCMPTLQALAVRFAASNKRGAAVSTFFIFFDLGFGFGTVFWGQVAAWAGYRQMYLATLLPLILGGLIYYIFMSSRIRATGGHL